MTEQTSVARRYLDYFGALGVPVIFGLPGVHNLAFWRDVDPDCPPLVGVRHEQTTVYAADGLARATGGLGVALTTTGPGAANAVAAFGEAAACGSPVVLVASEISTQLARPGQLRGVLHESRDQAGMFEPLAKAVFRPRSAAQAVAALREAVDTALAWPRGPVYIDIPTDVLSLPAMAPLPPDEPERQIPCDGAVRSLADLVNAVGSVVLWCGSGVIQSGAETAVREMAERLGAPVVTSYGARGLLPSNHPLAVSLPPHEPEVAQLIASADLMLAIGTDFDAMMTRNWRMPMPGKLAVINCNPEDLSKNFNPDLAVMGDARETLARLIPLLEEKKASRNDAAERGWRRLELESLSAPSVEFVRRVAAAAGSDTVVVCDMAVAGYWYGGYAQVDKPRRLQYPVGWGTLGYALPASVGPAAAGMHTLAICGDGGVMFALSELATIAQERLPVTLLIVDDGAYGMLAYDQEVAGDPEHGVQLMSPDWEKLGQAFRVPTTVLSECDAILEKNIRAAVESGGPHMIVLAADLFPPRTTSPRWFE